MRHLADTCPVCAGLVDYCRLMQGYLRNPCARLVSPMLSEMVFRLQTHLKSCSGHCEFTVDAIGLHADSSLLLSDVWKMLNEHRMFLEWAMHPYEVLKNSGVDLTAMRGYLDSHGILPLRNPESDDSEYAAALDKYLNLCEREGLYHIVDRWEKAFEPELALEPPF